MTMLTVFIEFDFHAAHTLPKQLSVKCANLHGHTYRGRLYVKGLLVNDMVVEASILKKALYSAVDLFDHAYIAGAYNPLLPPDEVYTLLKNKGHRIYFLDANQASTVENISIALLKDIIADLKDILPASKYAVWLELMETDSFGCVTEKVEFATAGRDQ